MTKLLIPALLAALCLAAPAVAQDKKAADKPKAAEEKKADAKAATGKGTTKTLVENDKVLVQEVRYKPGEASDMRERNARVTRALSDGTMERVYADGKKETVHWKSGDVKYFPKETFQNKNVGKTEMVLFVTTLK
jgi:hypothetical protein